MRAADIKQADDRLADAYWWLKGFAESRQSVCGMEGPLGESNDLALKIMAVRNFLSDVELGRIRRLGEETAIVLTFPEWERICDFLLIKPTDDHELKIAISTARTIQDEYRAQERDWRDSRNPEIPF